MVTCAATSGQDTPVQCLMSQIPARSSADACSHTDTEMRWDCRLSLVNRDMVQHEAEKGGSIAWSGAFLDHAWPTRQVAPQTRGPGYGDAEGSLTAGADRLRGAPYSQGRPPSPSRP